MVVRGTRSTSGDGTAVAAADPATNKLYVGPWLQLQNKHASSGVNVKVKLGSTEIYDVKLNSGDGVIVADLPEDVRTGAAGESLYVNLSDAVDVYYQIQVKEIGA